MLDDDELDIPEESSSANRTFRLIGGILGVILLLALIGAAIYAFVILPGQQHDELPEDILSAVQSATAEALALQATATTEVEEDTATATATRTATATATTEVPTATLITPIFTFAVNAQTATVNALLTQAALSQTEVAGTSTPDSGTPATPILVTATLPSTLPQSGFADDVGLPGLFGATALLLAIILLARRMRAARR